MIKKYTFLEKKKKKSQDYSLTREYINNECVDL